MDKLKDYSRQLRLGNLAEIYDQVEFENRRQYLTGIMELMIQQRRLKRTKRLIKRAGFPAPKKLDNYDFSPITFPKGFNQGTLLRLDFIEQEQNLLMLGAVGTGKTHLAIALGMKACSEGRKVIFYRAADLTNELVKEHRAGKVGDLVNKIGKADLFILDEVGYVPFDRQGAQLLFTVISKGYEQQSIITTSNLEFGRWNEVFGDDRLTAALIDRLVHHAHILAFEGQSYRLKQALADNEK